MKSFIYIIIILALLLLTNKQVTNAQNVIRTEVGIALPSTTCVSTGNGGQALSARLCQPAGIAVDKIGNIYFSDQENNVVRKVQPNGIITRFAGTGSSSFGGDNGPATNARLYYPQGLALDTLGNLFIADNGNNRVRKVDTNGIITTVAGNGVFPFSSYIGDGGQATNARIGAYGLATDLYGNLFISDGSSRVRIVYPTGIIQTYAGSSLTGYYGNGIPATSAALHSPTGIAVDKYENLYIADLNSQTVRKVNGIGIITTIAGIPNSPNYTGDNVPATSTHLWYPVSIALDTLGNVYVGKETGPNICRIDTAGYIHYFAGNGYADYYGDGGNPLSAALNYASAICFDKNNNFFIADFYNNVIREIIPPDSITIFSNHSDSICAGGTATFNATIKNPGYGYSYQWMHNTTPVGTDSNFLTIGSLSNGDSIRCILIAPGGKDTFLISNSILITVTPLVYPTLSFTNNIDTICAGTPVTYLAHYSYGGSTPVFEWFVNGVQMIDSDSIFTYYPAHGEYVTCKMISSEICPVPDTVLSIDTIAEFIHPNLATSDTVIAYPGTSISYWTNVLFYCEGINFGSAPHYQWLLNGMPILGATNSTYSTVTLQHNDIIRCILTSNAPCASPLVDTSYPLVINITNVGIKTLNHSNNNISIYPNPNKGTFLLSCIFNGVDYKEANIQIMDLLGKVIYNEKTSIENGKLFSEITLIENSGVYFVKVNTGNAIIISRLIIER